MIEPTPITLTGRFISLAPLNESQAGDLLAAATPEIFDYLSSMPALWSAEGFREYIQALRSRPNTLGFAIVDRRSGRAVGITCYLSIVLEHSTIEIGTTWIGQGFQGMAVNPESKL